MLRKVITLSLAAGCAAIPGGCGTAVDRELGWGRQPSYTGSELTEDQPTDIPVPNGYRMVRKSRESFSFDMKNGGFRDARLVYVGKLSVASVAHFYRKTMVVPTYGWTDRTGKDGARPDGGAQTLRFEKESDKGRVHCTVVIAEETVTPLMRSRVEIDLKTLP